MPFVQGHLRNEPVAVSIRSECAHCARPLEIEIDSQLHYRVAESAAPLVFVPLVDFAKLKDPSIINVF
ncbi:MAG: hypothetical protein HY699_19880 [Deltaproteobacteria bacterium]|nr:hypothetical protein [Deltaproteobacteria bacterium]